MSLKGNKGIAFCKYEGTGNDFILMDDRNLEFPIQDQELIRKLCHRRFGIGADGLILLQQDSHADFRMRIFNSDGKEAEGCGNGLRCLMRFLLDIGMKKTPYKIAVGSRILFAEYQGEWISVVMGKMENLQLHYSLVQEGVPLDIHIVNSGVPHVVQFIADVQAIDFQKRAYFLRHHPLFLPAGVNVNFAALQPDGSICVRSFERGIEGETLACGTGATAVAVVAMQLFHIASPVRIRFQGGDLDIYFDGKVAKMAGPAKKVFEGWVKSFQELAVV